MTNSNAVYEVETRFQFVDKNEAYRVLPFLRSSLKLEIRWETDFFGIDIFKSGGVLRASKIFGYNGIRHFLTWKGPDTGSFANIRQELGEEITNGIKESDILKHLGGLPKIDSPDGIIEELRRLGHEQYMSFNGTDYLGEHKPLDIRVKLMVCPDIRYSILVEFEKIARTEEEAKLFEKDLRTICTQLHLEGRIIREEPPDLLYDVVFDTQK